MDHFSVIWWLAWGLRCLDFTVRFSSEGLEMTTLCYG